MSKKPPILKHWLTNGSIAFGVSAVCALPFNHNFAQSALIGLATMPGLVTSITLRSRQRQLQLDSRLTRKKLKVAELEQQSLLLNEQLQLRENDGRAIETKIRNLHEFAISLTARIERDRELSGQLESQILELEDYNRSQRNQLATLEEYLLEKQADRLEIEKNVSQLQFEQQEAKKARNRAEITLKNVHNEIDKSLKIKQDLELYIRNCESRRKIEQEEYDRAIEVKQLLLQELSDRLKLQSDPSTINKSLLSEISELEKQIGDRLQPLRHEEQNSLAADSQLESRESNSIESTQVHTC